VPSGAPAAAANIVREVFSDLKAVSHQCAMQTETQCKPYVQQQANCVQRAFLSLLFAKQCTRSPNSAPVCQAVHQFAK